MRAYDSGYRPPAPVVNVTLTHPDSARTCSVRGKLDTGADSLVIPLEVAERLGLESFGNVPVRGYDGSITRRPVYYAHVVVEGFEFKAVRCLATERVTVLVGRSILNRLIVTLDGPNLAFDLKSP